MRCSVPWQGSLWNKRNRTTVGCTVCYHGHLGHDEWAGANRNRTCGGCRRNNRSVHIDVCMNLGERCACVQATATPVHSPSSPTRLFFHLASEPTAVVLVSKRRSPHPRRGMRYFGIGDQHSHPYSSHRSFAVQPRNRRPGDGNNEERSAWCSSISPAKVSMASWNVRKDGGQPLKSPETLVVPVFLFKSPRWRPRCYRWCPRCRARSCTMPPSPWAPTDRTHAGRTCFALYRCPADPTGKRHTTAWSIWVMLRKYLFT